MAIHDTPIQFPSLASSGRSDLLASHFGDHIAFWDNAFMNKCVGLVIEHAGLQSAVGMALSRQQSSGGEHRKIII